MTFRVLMCPTCRQALICDGDVATTGCGRCDKRVQLDGARIFHETDDHTEAVRYAGALNARQDGDLEAYLDAVEDDDEGPTDASDAAVRRARDRSGEADKARTLAVELADRDALTEARMAEALRRLDMDPAEAKEWLDRFVLEGDLYEPRPGRYRWSASDGPAGAPR